MINTEYFLTCVFYSILGGGIAAVIAATIAKRPYQVILATLLGNLAGFGAFSLLPISVFYAATGILIATMLMVLFRSRA